MAHIIVCEDEESTRAMVATVLRNEGHKVEAFGNGLEASLRLKEGPVDILLSDVEMPLRNGFELLREVREQPEMADMPCILLTSLSERTHMRIGMTSGADDYLTKPVKPRELIEAINHQLERSQQRQEQQTKKLNKTLEATMSDRTTELMNRYEKRLERELTTRWARTDDSPSQLMGSLVLVNIARQSAWLAQLSEHGLTDLVADFYTKVSDNAALFQADHLQFVGDGLLVVFSQAPDSSGHEHRIRCRKFLSSLPQIRASVQGQKKYQTGIGDKQPLIFDYCAAVHEATLNLAKLSGIAGGIDQIVPVGASMAELSKAIRLALSKTWSMVMSEAAAQAYSANVEMIGMQDFQQSTLGGQARAHHVRWLGAAASSQDV